MDSPPVTGNSLKVWIYKSTRRLETYLYVARADDFSALPPDLLTAMGKLELVMEIDLHPERKLARANPQAVISAISEKGYYLQLPPLDRPGEARVH